jgi:hypothetical protein
MIGLKRSQPFKGMIHPKTSLQWILSSNFRLRIPIYS